MDGTSRTPDNLDAEVFEDGICRLVLIGKSRTGKSATANTIIGKDYFQESSWLHSAKSIGYNCVKKDNLTIEVIDTPGLEDTDDDDTILVEEIQKSFFAMYPGPHAILLVLSYSQRFTREDFQIYLSLKKIFGAQFTSYVIVIFTSVSSPSPEFAKHFEEQIPRNKYLNTILTEASWRYVFFDNKAVENEKQLQVNILLKKVQSLALTNQPSYFRHNFSDHLRSTFDEMVKDEIKLLTMLTKNSDASSDTSDAQVCEDGTYRLVLIGKTGSGKSATANTIIGKNCFKEKIGINSGTKEGGFNYVKRDNLTIEVMDTPGLADTQDDDEILVEEIKKSVFAMHPGPHALLLVLRGDARFTKEEFQVYQALKEIFGAQFASFLIVVFTYVNAKEEYAQILEDEIRKNEKLNTLLNEANWRYVLFDNKADENEKRGQVDELLGKVKSLVVTNQSSYFRHHFLDHLRASFDEMANDELKLLRKKMLRNSGDASNVTTQEQETHDGGSVSLQVIQMHEANESNERFRVRKLAQHFNQLVLNPLPKRMGKTDPNDENKNALESDKKKCEILSGGNKTTEQASIEVDNWLHRQSKIDIKDKIVNQPEKMTETQRHEYVRSLSELPDKVKEGFEKENVKDKEQCRVM